MTTFTLNQIKAAVILALKDVNELSIPSLKRVANNPDDPRRGKAKALLKKNISTEIDRKRTGISKVSHFTVKRKISLAEAKKLLKKYQESRKACLRSIQHWSAWYKSKHNDAYKVEADKAKERLKKIDERIKSLQQKINKATKGIK